MRKPRGLTCRQQNILFILSPAVRGPDNPKIQSPGTYVSNPGVRDGLLGGPRPGFQAFEL